MLDYLTSVDIGNLCNKPLVNCSQHNISSLYAELLLSELPDGFALQHTTFSAAVDPCLVTVPADYCPANTDVGLECATEIVTSIASSPRQKSLQAMTTKLPARATAGRGQLKSHGSASTYAATSVPVTQPFRSSMILI